MSKAVVLLSGGLDSLTCLMVAKSQGYEPYAISFDYGQKHRAGLQAAANICKHYNIKHQIIELHALGKLGGSALTDAAIKTQDYTGSTNIPATYVPARNTVFLSIALGLAETITAEAIYLGANAVDYSGYPDCRPEYLEAFQKLIDLATKAGLEGHPIKLVTPVLQLNKAKIIQLGAKLGADFSLSVSCYRANEQGQACGNCDSCHFRREGFIKAGLEDPTQYFLT